MIITKIGGLECDPLKVSRISCEGMKLLLYLPCVKSNLIKAISSDTTINIEARKAYRLAESLLPKIVPKSPGGGLEWYLFRVSQSFNWKQKAQYNFAEYTFTKFPLYEVERTCVYLGRAPFVWSKYNDTAPEPVNVYSRFKDIPMNPDGSPALRIPSSAPTYEPITPLWPYNDEELKLISNWQQAINYYDRELKACIAKYEKGG